MLPKHIRLLLPALMILAAGTACTSTQNSTAEKSGAIDRKEANRRLVFSLRFPHPVRMTTALKQGANPDTCDANGVPVLIRSVAAEHIEQVKLLLRSGANVNARDTEGDSALHVAVSLEKPDIAMLLLENRADVNASSKTGRTPAMEAARLGNLDMLKTLEKHGADLFAVDDRGASLATFAAAAPKNSIESLEYLKSKGILSKIKEPSVYTSPLLLAQFCHNDETVLYLLDNLPDFDKDGTLDAVGQVSIRLAILNNQEKIFDKLLQKKLRLNRTLPLAFRAAQAINVEGVYKFLARNGMLDRGYTPLILACIAARPEMITKLVEAGADPSLLTNEGQNAYHYANDQASYDALSNAEKSVRKTKLNKKINGLQKVDSGEEKKGILPL